MRAPATTPGAQPLPIRAVLAIDVSASMSGEPLRQVVRSAQRIAALLRPDQLGVVGFSEWPQDATDVDKGRAQSPVDEIDAWLDAQAKRDDPP